RQLIAAIATADARAALDALDALYMQGMDMRFLLETIATAWQDIATCQLLGEPPADDQAHWVELAEQTQPGDVQLFYDIALSGLRDLDYAPDPLVGTRMTVLRMLAFAPASADGTDAVPPPAATAKAPNRRQPPEPAPEAKPRPAQEPAPGPVENMAPPPAVEPVPAPEPEPEVSPGPAPEPEPKAVSEPAAPAIAASDN